MPALGFRMIWVALQIDVYPDLAMQTILRAGLFFLIIVATSPAGGAECPEGTRNNYKGECVSISLELEKEGTQTQQEEAQKWSEPTKGSGVVEGVVPKDNVEEVAGDSSAGSTVIVEEVVTADDDESLARSG